MTIILTQLIFVGNNIIMLQGEKLMEILTALIMAGSFLTAKETGVSIDTRRFVPEVKEITVKDCVSWTNGDRTKQRHDVYIPSIKVRSKPLRYGETFRYCFENSGEYKYICSFHPGMKGVVKVL